MSVREIVFHFAGTLRVQHVGTVPFHFATPEPPHIELRIVGTLPALSGRLRIGPVILLSVRATFASLGGLVSLHYRPDVWAPLTVSHLEDFREMELLTAVVTGQMNTGPELALGTASSVRAGAALDALMTIPVHPTRPIDVWGGDAFRAAQPLDAMTQDGFRQMLPIDVWANDRWRQAAALDWVGTSKWRQAATLDLGYGFRLRPARVADVLLLETAGDSRPLDRWLRSPFREAGLLVMLSVPFPLTPIPPGPAAKQRIEFHFGWVVRPKSTFHFPSVRRAFLVIPIREFYRVIPDARLVRLPDRTEIPIESFQVSVDIGLSLHGLTATIMDRQGFNRLQSGAGVQVELTAQGYVWHFLTNRLSGSRRFGEESYNLEGMSLARALGRGRTVPRSYIETAAMTLQQLAEQELIFSGWALDWQAPTWLVPAGTWSYDRVTPLEAIQALADAAGAAVQAGRADQSLIVQPRYRILPWLLADTTPDVILPADPVEILSFESEPREDYTAVYVHGTTPDRMSAHVVISDSGGLVVPDEPQTNALLTAYDGLRAFGARYLADHQSATRWSLLLPLTAADGDVPLLDIGQIIQFSGDEFSWRGIVENVKVAMTGVELTQTIEVVTYG